MSHPQPAQQYGPPDKCDRHQREVAAKLTRAMRYWVVIWGAWSRAYWGFPCFAAPEGTILWAEDSDEMLMRIARVEEAAHARGVTIPARPRQPAPVWRGQQ
jgi:hypothetical protein